MMGADLEPLWLSFRLAGIAAFLLLLMATPLAWWLARTRSRLKPVIEAATALPLVLPPTVLGFYLLLVFNPSSPFGGFFNNSTKAATCSAFKGLAGIPWAARSATCSRYSCNTVMSSWSLLAVWSLQRHSGE